MTAAMGAGASSVVTDSLSPSNTQEQLATAQPPPLRKKGKVGGFATLRKKLMRRRRCSKVTDHGRMIRDAVSDWAAVELACLLDEYEALAALKDLHVQAELARPPAPTFKQDLSTLYDLKHCTDVDLVFRGVCFPVHRAILSARCTYFRDLLAGCPGYGARICLELRTCGVEVEVFSALLRYLYTGDLSGPAGVDMALLRRLGEEFGHPASLEHDLRYLLETGDYADAALVFTSDSDYHRPDSGSSEYGFRPKLELPCHKAILSARSPFFRSLIQRRSRSGEETTERVLHIPTRIVLDESVIPKRYARVLLNAIYLDAVDLSLIMRPGGPTLGDAEAMTYRGSSALEEAMELYQIGRFLELDIVSQGCEDAIIESLTIENLPIVLRWGREGHGSGWVLRQARQLLREEFSSIAHSNVLYQLDKADLIDALSSDFLQASELDILQAVLKWGEHHLIRRMEDREPNVVSQTTHSVARKGIKKRDMSDSELRELLADVLPLVRSEHVLPRNSEILMNAIRRGLVSTPPPHMIGDRPHNPWLNNRLYPKPRLFNPYYEEVKAIVDEQMVGETELMRIRRSRYIADIPDTLYMVEERPTHHHNIDVIAHAIPVPDVNTMSGMLKRECKLRQSPSCQRALALSLSSRKDINRQIRLRVVREFNLPDPVALLLENASSAYRLEEDEDVATNNKLRNRTSYADRRTLLTYPRPHHLPAVVTEGSAGHHPRSRIPDRRVAGGGTIGGTIEIGLSRAVPDVAMATCGEPGPTAADTSESSDSEQLALDLGDGTSHTRPPPPPHRFI